MNQNEGLGQMVDQFLDLEYENAMHVRYHSGWLYLRSLVYKTIPPYFSLAGIPVFLRNSLQRGSRDELHLGVNTSPASASLSFLKVLQEKYLSRHLDLGLWVSLPLVNQVIV